ncbi:MAG: glycosyltransferase family 2 protein [Bacteroidota bacterium]
MIILVYIIASLVLLYLGWGVLYQLLFAVVGRWWQVPKWAKAGDYQRIVVLIPGYREDAVIVNTAQHALDQNYPQDKYEVVVIADSFSAETLDTLRSLPIRVEEVAFTKSTKSKSLNACFDRLGPDAYDIAVILDADNLMQPNFLQRVNDAFAQGVRVLQGRRAAKNNDTTMAILDGLSEDVNNHILCAGHARCGLSARLAGSGMAFGYNLLRETMKQVDAIGGFDKELELRLTHKGERVYYDPEALVLDEKVRKGDHFARQRSRWIAAQFHYARRFFLPAVHAWLWKGKFDHFNKASQMLLPPRLLTPGILAIGGALLLLAGFTSLATFWWLVLGLNLLTFALSMPAYAWQSPYRDALFRVPVAFWHAVRSMVGIHRANRQFIHTPHGEGEK